MPGAAAANAVEKKAFEFVEGQESEGDPGAERPHALYSFDDFLANVPCDGAVQTAVIL